ncbi:PBPRA1643 family SWIM/SEC-C metal-binding motif protein [Vibrio sp. F74]|uniref:PBPRA1643 family SWIM/SEC-C metal-binding motif protein n=1 Tax=Vibrio sp. F74 TaxID=700020 RepID=UPI0035F538EF
MSKFFYRGTPDIMSNYGKNGYKTNAEVKPGTSNYPLSLTVISQQRKDEVQSLIEQHQLFANIEIDSEAAEDISELDAVLNKPKTQRFDKKPERNDPCSCGSKKKYKKCCGK